MTPKEVIALDKEDKKLNRWKEKMLEEDKLPPLYYKDKEQLDQDAIRFLFYRMSLFKNIGMELQAKIIIEEIDRTTSNDFAQHILDAYIKNGTKPPKKYIMALAGLLGSDDLVDSLKSLFDTFNKKNRWAMAIHVIDTMMLIGSNKALRQIDYLTKSRQKPSIMGGAKEALVRASKERKMKYYDLLDSIIPDFGFDGLHKEIDVNGDTFRVFVTNDFKLNYMDENNKIRKSVPAKASTADKEELKSIQKDLRETNKSQVDRLENYMVEERKWDIEGWQKNYLNNPLMFIHSSSLLWGVFNQKNKLLKLFYVDEDSSLLDEEEDDVELKKSYSIMLMHPLQMTTEQLSFWSEHFYEREVMTPFTQLNRKTFSITSEEEEKTTLTRYNDKKPQMAMGTLIRNLEKRGWQKNVVDSGNYDYYKVFNKHKLVVDIGIYGINPYFDDTEYLEMTGIKFQILTRYEDKKLKDIPNIVFSEVIYDMELIIGV